MTGDVDFDATNAVDQDTLDALLQSAEDALEQIEDYSRKSWEDWMIVGEAEMALVIKVMRDSGANQPNGRVWAQAFGRALNACPHARLKKLKPPFRSRLRSVMQHRKEIEEWLQSLPENERALLNNPEHVWKRWHSDFGADDKEPRKGSAPKQELIAANSRLQEILDAVCEAVGVEQGDHEELLRRLDQFDGQNFSVVTDEEHEKEITKWRSAAKQFQSDLETVTRAVSNTTGELERLKGKSEKQGTTLEKAIELLSDLAAHPDDGDVRRQAAAFLQQHFPTGEHQKAQDRLDRVEQVLEQATERAATIEAYEPTTDPKLIEKVREYRANGADEYEIKRRLERDQKIAFELGQIRTILKKIDPPKKRGRKPTNRTSTTNESPPQVDESKSNTPTEPRVGDTRIFCAGRDKYDVWHYWSPKDNPDRRYEKAVIQLWDGGEWRTKKEFSTIMSAGGHMALAAGPLEVEV